jgi:type II secretory pathway pseudopilin PulG
LFDLKIKSSLQIPIQDILPWKTRMSFHTFKLKRKRSGFTLIEVGIASVLMAVVVSGVLMLVADYIHGQVAQAQAQQLATVNAAVTSYEAKYATNLANNQAIPVPGFANVANIYSPSTTELFHLGLLANAPLSTLYATKISSTLVNGSPSGMAWLVAPFTKANGQPDQALAGLAMTAAGGDAAMSTVANPTVVMGADGWSAANPATGTPAALLVMRNGAGSNAFVRLDGSTPMQGSLNVGGFNVTNAGTVSAATVTAPNINGTNVNVSNINAANVSTTNLGASNIISAGNYVSSSGNIYAGQNISASGNTSGSTLTATANGNDIFFGSSALYSDGWNAVVRTAGGAVYAQNMGGGAVPVVASQLVTPQGNGVQIGSSYYYGDGTNSAIRQNGQLYVQNQAGTGPANVDLNYVHINGTANVGWGCAPNGMQAQDGSGAPLFCVNGSWQQPSGRPNIITRVGGQSNTLSIASCAGNEVMTGGMCYNTDGCGGNDSSAFGGYPSGNSMYCPRTSASLGCDTLTAYVFCAQ